MKKKNAFTLVELSVSLIVIGLITAGITGGIYIKKRADLTHIMEQMMRLQSGYYGFKQIYNALPGDLPAYSTPTFGTSYAGTAVLYGNGDGKINNPGALPSGNTESIIALQHLNIAGLLPGNFSGNWNSSTSLLSYLPEISNNSYGYYFGSSSNTPGANFTIFDSNANSNNSSIIVYARIFDNNNNSIIDLPGEAMLGALSPSDMYLIDLKYDDGYPKTGNIIAADSSDNSGRCLNISPTPNIYVASKNKNCYFGYILDKNAK